MKDIEGKTALVTGAGSGIGRATAIALAEAGARVAVTDVNGLSAAETADAIRSMAHEARAFVLDVSNPGEITAVAQEVEEAMGVPSVLVNNAGIAVGGYFPDTSTETWDRVMSINLMGVIHCCRAFVPRMLEVGQSAQVVNISSLLGFAGSKGVSAYCATKFGVLGFSESLRAELAEHGIGVSVICPGMIRTNIINSSVLESSEEDVEEKRVLIDAFYQKRNYTPERVARAIMKAIRRNRAVVPVTAEAWATYYAKRWAPWLVAWVARRDMV